MWNVQYMRVFGLLQPFPGDFWSNHVFRVTSGHLRWRDISLHVTASYCELQPCRKWNVQYMSFWPSKLIPGDFQRISVTSGSLPVTWGHVTSFTATWPPPLAIYSLVGSEMYSIPQFSDFYSHFEVTSGQMTWHQGHFRSPDVTSRHFLSRDCILMRAIAL